MAIIQPYADPSAHGKVTPGLAFIRRGNKVSFGANRRPRNKNTAAQQIQRAKVTQAVEKYRQLNFEEKIFLRRRGSMISKNQYNLFVSSQLKNQDWSQVKGHVMQEVNDMVIFNLQQDNPDDVKFSLISSNSQVIRDAIALYNKMDSETGGVVTSDDGPDLTWVGTPSHLLLKFANGAFNSSTADYLTVDDDGQFFKDIFDNHMFSCWIKTNFDVTNGIAQDGNNHVLFEHRGLTVATVQTRIQLVFSFNIGVYLSVLLNGVLTFYVSTDSNITFNAGDVIYFSYAYVKAGIDDEDDTFKMYIGTDTTLHEVASFDNSVDSITAPLDNFRILLNNAGTVEWDGGVDNIKFIEVHNQTEIDEMNNTRNSEEFEVILGDVLDNSNIFTPGLAVGEVPELKLKIENFSINDWSIPFYWALAITWSNLSITERTTVIRLPKAIINSSDVGLFFLSQDLSSYFDENLYRLGATDNI